MFLLVVPLFLKALYCSFSICNLQSTYFAIVELRSKDFTLLIWIKFIHLTTNSALIDDTNVSWIWEDTSHLRWRVNNSNRRHVALKTSQIRTFSFVSFTRRPCLAWYRGKRAITRLQIPIFSDYFTNITDKKTKDRRLGDRQAYRLPVSNSENQHNAACNKVLEIAAMKNNSKNKTKHSLFRAQNSRKVCKKKWHYGENTSPVVLRDAPIRCIHFDLCINSVNAAPSVFNSKSFLRVFDYRSYHFDSQDKLASLIIS